MESQGIRGATLTVAGSNNESHHKVLIDRKHDVDGDIYRELKTLNRVVIGEGPHSGKEVEILVHTRSIGNKNVSVSENNGIESNDYDDDIVIETFKAEWNKNWPYSTKRRGVKGFFKKMLGYE
jgi:hypothetical protein